MAAQAVLWLARRAAAETFMSKLLHFGLMLGALAGITALAAGCDGGFDNAESVEICEDIRERLDGSMTDATLAMCVTCFEDCGRDCQQLEEVPLQFVCE